MSWCPNGRIIAVGNDDDVLCFIDARKLRALHQKKYNHQVNEFGWNASGSHFFMTSLGGNGDDKSMGTVEISSCGEGDGTLSHEYSVQAHTAACYCIDFDPTMRLFAVGSADSLVSLWSLEISFVCARSAAWVTPFAPPDLAATGLCLLREARTSSSMWHLLRQENRFAVFQHRL